MEVLSEILRTMRVRGSVYFCDQLEAPWSKRYEDAAAASFHQVRRGDCWLSVGDRVEHLGPGDLLFVGPGIPHTLASHPPDAPGDGGAGTVLLCGYCDLGRDVATPLAKVFPEVAVLRDAELRERPWLHLTLQQLGTEYLSRQPGTELVVNRLTEIVLVELIRMSFGRDEQAPFVRALDDPQIARALERLHAAPQRGWTIEGLAAQVGLSRAALARRFRELVGQPVFEYLTGLRIQRARELLVESKLPVYEVATRVGYESELAFTRTFRRHAGVTPLRYRKRADAREPA